MTIKTLPLNLLALFILQLPGQLIAQKNFQEGFLITLQEDTIKGFIDFQEWDKNPKSIIFKESPEALEETISPLDIIAFCVNDEYYLGATLSVDRSPHRIEEMSYSPVPIFETDIVFLRILVKGKKSLYYLKDKDSKQHFYIEKNGEYEELIFRDYLKRVNGKLMVMTVHQYRHQLSSYLDGCITLKGKISNIRYGVNTLTQLFEDYNNCTKAHVTYVYKKEKFEWHPVILGGMANTSIKFKGSLLHDLRHIKFNNSTSFSFGLGINIIFPRDRKRWSFYNDLLVKSFRFDATIEKNFLGNLAVSKFISLEATYLSLNNLIRYQVYLKKLRPFINAGFYNAKAININKNYKRTETYLSSSSYIDEDEAIENYKKFEQGLVFGVGCMINQFSLESRFVISNGMSNYNNLTSPIKTLSLLAGVSF